MRNRGTMKMLFSLPEEWFSILPLVVDSMRIYSYPYMGQNTV